MTASIPGEAETVADRARRVVRASGMSQREFAARIGMDQTALSKGLRGTRRLSDTELRAIARVGRVPLKFLTSDAATPPAALLAAEERSTRLRAEPVDAQVRRNQILEATARLIAQRGFHSVRVADIARVCDTSPATLHYHFSSKDDALRDALAFYSERLHQRLAEEFATVSSPVDKLRRLIDVQLPASPEDVEEWSVWVQSWNEAMIQPSLRDPQRQAYARWRDVVLGLIRECQATGLAADADADLLATRFTALVDGLAIQLLTGTPHMTVDRMREVLLDSFEPHLSLR
ncbi:MAG TPA: TetR/AcrR family transcriptional regulator [Nocardioides sp.]|uniref:TetR/AcrR family transcriptional regulator n=1 Tax=Nocardioides sp. TaxID=35761 RepID=UPI002EDABDD1